MEGRKSKKERENRVRNEEEKVRENDYENGEDW